MTKTGKRKLLTDPVAAAALDALSSILDDDLPIATKKKKLSASSAAKKKTGSEGRIRNSLRHLKPLFEEGDDVCAAWWPDAKSRRDSVGEWFPGVVKSYRDDVESGSPYGPTRYYDIVYDDDDGDEL
eukprot:CAMPEP_0172300760 /NCGR_PEP_ID=MMETSP1058-20130122/2785_1 /TAXON_ID=83371 /ORGANISM="Detonula confervacea, Strain CCMP 353" /LENGTH=126 /DNA_ID=CAMNT_0013010645 /DNA_START=125 /DNA_END=503 /DNA_ORIENTATION=-